MSTSQKTILIIDDEASIRDLLKTMLGQAGYAVIEAVDAESGMKLALEKHPDLIICDVIMPHQDGLTMLQSLRDDAWGKSVPVIVASNLDDEGSLQIAKDCDVACYIVKTNLVPDVVVAKVKELIS